jgi:hypothetical protein
MVRKILIGVAVIVAGLLVVVATRPPTFHIERSITMSAPPEAPFALVNDFHAWPSWSPWERVDPGMKKTYEGAPSGTGSVYSWVGNEKVGEGRMTIERSDKPSLVSIKLEFLKPFAATNTAMFTFVPGPDGTKVTWAMDGQKNLMAKAFHMVMNMDKMVGGDFEKGLTAMKVAAETAAKANAEAANAAK